jgi:hypothetical protein
VPFALFNDISITYKNKIETKKKKTCPLTPPPPPPPPKKKKKSGKKKSLPVHLKYDLFAVNGDVTTCFHHSFTFFILQTKQKKIVIWVGSDNK